MGSCVSRSMKQALHLVTIDDNDFDQIWAKRITTINDYLALSGLPAVASQHTTSEDLINYQNIRAVISCIKGQKRPAQIDENFDYLHCELDDDDDENLMQHLPQIFEFVEKNSKSNQHPNQNSQATTTTNCAKILIFCQYGISRSAAVAIACLIHFEKMSLRDAYRRIKNRRPIICPNIGFFRQLIQLEQQLLNTKSVKILEISPDFYCADVVWEEILEETNQKQQLKFKKQEETKT